METTDKVFNVTNVKQEAEKICLALQKVAPWVVTKISMLGGDENVCILIHVSLDEKSTWINGIVENSRRFMVDFTCHGVLNQFIKERELPNFRKRTVNSVDDAIKKLTEYVKKIEKTT